MDTLGDSKPLNLILLATKTRLPVLFQCLIHMSTVDIRPRVTWEPPGKAPKHTWLSLPLAESYPTKHFTVVGR